MHPSECMKPTHSMDVADVLKLSTLTPEVSHIYYIPSKSCLICCRQQLFAVPEIKAVSENAQMPMTSNFVSLLGETLVGYGFSEFLSPWICSSNSR